MTIYPQLKNYIVTLVSKFDSIPLERRARLDALATYIVDKRNAAEPAYLNFICTHNSRRSHMSQIWAAVAVEYFELDEIHCFSGGTESTAFNYRAVAALERIGFQIEHSDGDNPRYQVAFSPDAAPLTCFSKVYDDPSNPQSNFAAVMTCSHADAHCPFIPETTRISVPYEDPKEADDTPEESSRYDERVFQIGREMFYLMREVATF